jgi:hypothetical protein
VFYLRGLSIDCRQYEEQFPIVSIPTSAKELYMAKCSIYTFRRTFKNFSLNLNTLARSYQRVLGYALVLAHPYGDTHPRCEAAAQFPVDGVFAAFLFFDNDNMLKHCSKAPEQHIF